MSRSPESKLRLLQQTGKSNSPACFGHGRAIEDCEYPSPCEAKLESNAEITQCSAGRVRSGQGPYFLSLLRRYSHLAVLGIQANRCTQGENVGEVVLLEHMADINNLSLVLPLGARQCMLDAVFHAFHRLSNALVSTILSLSVYLAIKEFNLKVPLNRLSSRAHPVSRTFWPHLYDHYFWDGVSELLLKALLFRLVLGLLFLLAY